MHLLPPRGGALDGFDTRERVLDLDRERGEHRGDLVAELALTVGAHVRRDGGDERAVRELAAPMR